jgi:Arc/MetJ-type ribon-helix-helix transcriptional regulator
MNTVTINVTMPKGLMGELKQLVVAGWYTSVSEVLRSGARQIVTNEKLTINGFTREFEDEVLKAAAEPVDYSKVWESDKDIDAFFDGINKKVKRQKK